MLKVKDGALGMPEQECSTAAALSAYSYAAMITALDRTKITAHPRAALREVILRPWERAFSTVIR